MTRTVIDTAHPAECTTDLMGYPCRYLRMVPRRGAWNIMHEVPRCLALRRDLDRNIATRPMRPRDCPRACLEVRIVEEVGDE